MIVYVYSCFQLDDHVLRALKRDPQYGEFMLKIEPTPKCIPPHPSSVYVLVQFMIACVKTFKKENSSEYKMHSDKDDLPKYEAH